MHSPTVLENSRTRFTFALSEESSGGRPAQLKKRSLGDSQLPYSGICGNLRLEGVGLEFLVEDPVDEDGSRVNAPRAPVWCTGADIEGREISLCACSRRMPDIPEVAVSSSAG